MGSGSGAKPRSGGQRIPNLPKSGPYTYKPTNKPKTYREPRCGKSDPNPPLHPYLSMVNPPPAASCYTTRSTVRVIDWKLVKVSQSRT